MGFGQVRQHLQHRVAIGAAQVQHLGQQHEPLARCLRQIGPLKAQGSNPVADAPPAFAGDVEHRPADHARPVPGRTGGNVHRQIKGQERLADIGFAGREPTWPPGRTMP